MIMLHLYHWEIRCIKTNSCICTFLGVPCTVKHAVTMCCCLRVNVLPVRQLALLPDCSAPPLSPLCSQNPYPCVIHGIKLFSSQPPSIPPFNQANGGNIYCIDRSHRSIRNESTAIPSRAAVPHILFFPFLPPLPVFPFCDV